ncbi:MAG: hypothetical protein ABI704_22505 [Kofleriaceae bacterium]
MIAPACDPNSSNPWFRPPGGSSQQGCQGSQQSYDAQDGKVVSAVTLGPTVHNVTVTARDLDENREVTNTETYPILDHGFALDLPFGHYDIEITNETNAMLARYPDVVVDGEVTLDAPSVAQR